MFPPSPNEKAAEKSLTARIVYFIFGTLVGGMVILYFKMRLGITSFFGLEITREVFVGLCIAFGLLAALGGKGSFKSLFDQ